MSENEIFVVVWRVIDAVLGLSIIATYFVLSRSKKKVSRGPNRRRWTCDNTNTLRFPNGPGTDSVYAKHD